LSITRKQEVYTLVRRVLFILFFGCCIGWLKKAETGTVSVSSLNTVRFQSSFAGKLTRKSVLIYIELSVVCLFVCLFVCEWICSLPINSVPLRSTLRMIGYMF